MASSGEDAFSYSEPSGSSGSDASNESIDEYYDPSQLDEAFSDFSDEPAVRSVELPPRFVGQTSSLTLILQDDTRLRR